jgi:methylglutaconyl-CoA hydratase
VVLQVKEQPNGVLWLTLDRPAVKNALDPALIAQLIQAFSHLMPQHRAVCITGQGAAFCAGADLQWMQHSLHANADQLAEEAQALATLLHTVATCRVPVVMGVHGGVYGGGIGLLATADVVIADPNTVFCLSETRLGLMPAVISPWVIQKTGYSHLNALTLTAAPFNTITAQRIGLVHHIVQDNDANALLAQLHTTLKQILATAPQATQLAKQWASTLSQQPNPLHPSLISQAVDLITQRRQCEEGQEGMQAFLQKRSPNWVNTTINPTPQA